MYLRGKRESKLIFFLNLHINFMKMLCALEWNSNLPLDAYGFPFDRDIHYYIVKTTQRSVSAPLRRGREAVCSWCGE